MKRVPCSYEQCGGRRRSWWDFTPRKTRMIEVPDDHEGPAYCSIECAVYAGAMTVWSE